ncbi:MAG: hypothetical protein HFACDABA_02346 [Anaerolineales bacterium]|nr:hypothetical protein [Anaerolineales bacterium]
MVQKTKTNIATDVKSHGLIRGLIAGVAGVVFFTAFAGLLPSISILAVCISLGVGLIFLVASIWFNLRPTNLHARFLYFASITCYFVIIAFRGMAALIPRFSLYSGLFIIATVLLSHSFPIWNPKATKLIREELIAPRSKLGKIMFTTSVIAIPIIGIVIYFMLNVIGTQNKSIGLSVVLSIVFWILALILPFAFRTPNSPWEKS